MIDHISIGVRDLAASARFYDAILAPLGYEKMHDREKTVGWARAGKTHAEFWINARPHMPPAPADSGVHVCLRASNTAAIEAFHAAALAAGGTSDGAPGARPQYSKTYYAAFIRDPDGNKIEAVTFLAAK
ncbi:MAG TPA: VOC family protein [Xanthobacteraceae bacterium]|nr:VOC family protein [Xanthobacteraceae bacterium]